MEEPDGFYRSDTNHLSKVNKLRVIRSSWFSWFGLKYISTLAEYVSAELDFKYGKARIWMALERTNNILKTSSVFSFQTNDQIIVFLIGLYMWSQKKSPGDILASAKNKISSNADNGRQAISPTIMAPAPGLPDRNKVWILWYGMNFVFIVESVILIDLNMTGSVLNEPLLTNLVQTKF